MTRDEKIKRIYEVIADKTLSFGCIILGKDPGYEERLRFVCNEEEKGYQPRRMHVNSDEWSFMSPDELVDYIIIGHPVMIGDLLDWVLTQDFSNRIKYEYRAIREKKREPIDNQSDECINYIYSLTF